MKEKRMSKEMSLYNNIMASQKIVLKTSISFTMCQETYSCKIRIQPEKSTMSVLTL